MNRMRGVHGNAQMTAMDDSEVMGERQPLRGWREKRRQKRMAAGGQERSPLPEAAHSWTAVRPHPASVGLDDGNDFCGIPLV